MSRSLHRYIAVLASLLIVLFMATGALLSLYPSLEVAHTNAMGDISVAEMLADVTANVPTVEQLKLRPSGILQAQYLDGDVFKTVQIDTETGAVLRDFEVSATENWLTELHRSLFLGDNGRMVTGVGALLFFGLCASGLCLLARRLGGWRAIISPMKGSGLSRWHSEIGRVTVLALMLSSITGAYLTATHLEFIPDGSMNVPIYPETVSQVSQMRASDMPALADIPLSELRNLVFPFDDAAGALYEIETVSGAGYIDAGTGEILTWQDNNFVQNLYAFFFALHTGQGLWWLGLGLGIACLLGLFMAGMGFVIFAKSKDTTLSPKKNTRPQAAEIAIFVGSETGSTYGFAANLHDELVKAGKAVHTTSMQKMPKSLPNVKQVLILTSTYGDGVAPQGCEGFLAKLDMLNLPKTTAFAVLGFGEKNFEHYCAFARALDAAMDARGYSRLLPFHSVNNRSAQDFAKFGEALSDSFHLSLALSHHAKKQKTHRLILTKKRVFGQSHQAETTILRFQFAHKTWLQRLFAPRFAAGDLLAIVPHGASVSRYYSLASARKDGFIEIAVRKVHGGACSTMLCALEIGDCIDARFCPNPYFKPKTGNTPLVLIGAGAGIGALAGFVRGNDNSRPMTLFQGVRDSDDDLIYGEEFAAWLRSGTLKDWYLATSREEPRQYVQDKLQDEIEALKTAMLSGAQILVCGSQAMGRAVREIVIRECDALNMDFSVMKAKGLYVEDIF